MVVDMAEVLGNDGAWVVRRVKGRRIAHGGLTLESLCLLRSHLEPDMLITRLAVTSRCPLKQTARGLGVTA